MVKERVGQPPEFAKRRGLGRGSISGATVRRFPRLSKQQYKILNAGQTVATYHAQKEYPVVQALVCDDAHQFNWLGEEKMLS